MSILDRLASIDRNILLSMGTMLNQCKFEDALSIVEARLNKPFHYDDKTAQYFKIELVMTLIDIGSEGHIEIALRNGIAQLNTLYSDTKMINPGDYHFNLGNAKHALFRIFTSDYEVHKFKIPENIEYLLESKDHYWESLQYYLNTDKEPPIHLLNNLANALFAFGRLTEAIHFFDLILARQSDFPQANINRARSLLHLSNHTNLSTYEQLGQALFGFNRALQAPNISKPWKEMAENFSLFLKNKCEKAGYDLESLKHEMSISRLEAKSLSPYRLFCIEKKLALNEHSIYCSCAATAQDSIIISSLSVKTELMGECELILNRIKSEFGIARWLFFTSISESSRLCALIDQEITFTELYESEFIGASSEMLRTSFRLCFGILDKIAKAICTYFNLSKDSNENIYFDGFWKKPNKRNNTDERWEAIKSIENPFITALYSLASDLNKNGKLSDYKKWRNNLEHNLLILTQNDETNSKITSPYIENEELFQVVEVKEFREKTEHLLHLTAAAIFNYVFCIRYEAAKGAEQDSDKYFTLHEKLS